MAVTRLGRVFLGLLLLAVASGGTRASGSSAQGSTDDGPPPPKKASQPYLSAVPPAPLMFKKPDSEIPAAKETPAHPAGIVPATRAPAHGPAGDVLVTPGLHAPTAVTAKPAAPLPPDVDPGKLPRSTATYSQQ